VSNPPRSDESLPWEQLVAKAVHDMRSPLSTINTTLAVLRMAIHDPGKAEKLVGVIERQTGDLTEQLNRLVNDPGSFASMKTPD
jgi:signal transduction histidine kinase